MKPKSQLFVSCSFCLTLALTSGGSNTANAENESTTPPYVEIKGEVGVLRFSPDGKKFVTRDGDTLWLWDTESGKKLQRLEGNSPRFSPDGKKIVTEKGYTIRIWDLSAVEKQ